MRIAAFAIAALVTTAACTTPVPSPNDDTDSAADGKADGPDSDSVALNTVVIDTKKPAASKVVASFDLAVSGSAQDCSIADEPLSAVALPPAGSVVVLHNTGNLPVLISAFASTDQLNVPGDQIAVHKPKFGTGVSAAKPPTVPAGDVGLVFELAPGASVEAIIPRVNLPSADFTADVFFECQSIASIAAGNDFDDGANVDFASSI